MWNFSPINVHYVCVAFNLPGGDLSSISGSDSEDSDAELSQDEFTTQRTEESDDERSFHVEGIGHRHPRVFFRNSNGELLSLFRCVLHCRKVILCFASF